MSTLVHSILVTRMTHNIMTLPLLWRHTESDSVTNFRQRSFAQLTQSLTRPEGSSYINRSTLAIFRNWNHFRNLAEYSYDCSDIIRRHLPSFLPRAWLPKCRIIISCRHKKCICMARFVDSSEIYIFGENLKTPLARFALTERNKN